MSNVTGSFEHKSAVSSLPHDPQVVLASNCIREYFGPTVQLVADCMNLRGGYSTLSQILSTLRSKCRRKTWSKERIRLLASNPPSMQISPVRASLLVLLQHSMVRARKKGRYYEYELDNQRVRLLPRYPRYVEYAKKALDDMAASLIEQLLVEGRMRTVHAVVATVEYLAKRTDPPKSEKYTPRQAVLESFRRLVEGGFIQLAPEIPDEADKELEYGTEPPPKKRKVCDDEMDLEDPAVVSMLQGAYKAILPQDAVWRVNVQMFHDALRAFCLGRLVAERYGHRVQSCGSMITAALKYVANKKHAQLMTNEEDMNLFEPANIIKYLPQAIRNLLNDKPGGILPNLSRALLELSRFSSPVVIREIDDGGGRPEQAKYEVATRRLVAYLQDRITHQVVHDHFGEVAARICSILSVKGYLESDALAEAAMVPAKDTREILHRLYRANYIELFNLHQSRHHNPSTMIYLWSVTRPRMLKRVTNNVCTALYHLRLRRQHESEVGKSWIDRAGEEETDENDHETDRMEYEKFCLGLERLDCATAQLDETSMVLIDF